MGTTFRFGKAAVACCAIVATTGCKSFVEGMNAANENNRRVTVTINGAVIGPADQNGQAWDGPGLSPSDVSLVVGAVIKLYPVGQTPGVNELATQFTSELANTILATLDKPDAKGTATVFAGGQQVAFDLGKQQDTYTPIWNVRIPQLLIHGSAINVSLWDADLTEDDPIGAIVIDSQTMLAAEAAGGGPYAMDASTSTSGMIQRLVFTVSAY